MHLIYLGIHLMENNWIPKEVIIVEGRDDTKRLIETFGPTIKTIETNGSAVSRSLIPQIQRAAEQFGIIIFTDPDFQGERIRRIVTDMVPSAKQAYLLPEAAKNQHKKASLGVEHASQEAIITALKNVATPNLDDSFEEIPQATLIKLKLIGHPESKERRAFLASQFQLGHVNGKQLQKKLSLYQISEADIIEQLKKWEGASNES